MKTIIRKIIKWYFLNFIYIHLFSILLIINHLCLIYFLRNSEGIIMTSRFITVLVSSVFLIISLISISPSLIYSFDKVANPSFQLSSINELDNIHKRAIKFLFHNSMQLVLIKMSFYIFATAFLFLFNHKLFILSEPLWIFIFILLFVHIDNLTGIVQIVRRELSNVPVTEETLSPHQSEEESRYEELRSRFAFHNITKDIRNLKLYVDVLKNEEPQLLSKFTPLDELMEMISETLHKFKNSDTIRTKNPFLIYELFDNFLTLNKPDLIREGSNLQISYHSSESKDLAIHQVFYDVYQVLNNLIDNSRKAIAKTENKEIHIFTEVKTEGFVIFQVSDTGIGIDVKSRNRIFDIGYSTTGGDGLGLLFVQTTLKRFGGEISLLPNALSGFSTTFEVKIPIQKTT